MDLFDLANQVGTTEFQLFAAAARTRGVGVDGHGAEGKIGESMRVVNSVAGTRRGGPKEGSGSRLPADMKHRITARTL
jgi:hypothetical protein